MEVYPDIALAFMQSILPVGPWIATRIETDQRLLAETFFPGQEDAYKTYIQAHRKANQYYVFNPPTESALKELVFGKKQRLFKHEVRRVTHLHVDIDPRSGEDIEQEQARILQSLLSYVPKPTHIVKSGGGYNALWLLDTPISIADGSPSDAETLRRAEDIERYNIKIEMDLGADCCHDISRILRTPGTCNWPNATKLAKGRYPVETELVLTSQCSHSISQFTQAPPLNTRAIAVSAVDDNKVTHIPSLNNLADLPESLKILIAQGPLPGEEWDGDKSKRVLFVCCELIRLGIAFDIIRGIITDPRYWISQSVLNKKDVKRYAKRQVDRARDKVIDPTFALMNENHSFIKSYGNRVRILTMVKDVSDKLTPLFQSVSDFRNISCNYPPVKITTAKGKEKLISAFDHWIKHPFRRTYSQVVFEPELEEPAEFFNLWQGFSCEPIQGNLHLRYLDHIKTIICGGNDEHYQYLIRWMARVVQTPRTPSMVAPVLIGERGTGKSVFVNFFGQIFEPHVHIVDDVESLTGRFNSHLVNNVFIVAEEAFDPRSHRHEGVLKSLITGMTMSIEAKGVDRTQAPNYTHLIMTSNRDQVVPAGDHERRFLVLKVSSAKRQDREYFQRILLDQRNGGVSHLLHYLKSVDLQNFHVTQVPHTEALRDQQEHTIPLEVSWLQQRLEIGTWLSIPARQTSVFRPWHGPFLKEQLFHEYVAFMTEIKANPILTPQRFSRFLSTELPSDIGTQTYQIRNSDDHRPYVIEFPDLAVCRSQFDRNRGWSTHVWPATEGASATQGPAKVLPFPGLCARCDRPGCLGGAACEATGRSPF